MADMMSTLKGFLGDDADEKIGKAMEMLKSSGMLENKGMGDKENSEKNDEISRGDGIAKNEASFPSVTPEGLEMLGQIKGMFDRMTNTNDQRSNLLLSLRPFMRAERQQSIDRVTKLMNIARFSGLFKK